MEGYWIKIILTVIALVVLQLVKYIISSLVRKYGRKLQKTEVRIKQIRQVIAILVNITFFFIILLIWGVKADKLLVTISSVLAILGVALFAQWSILSNVTAGIIMFFAAPFRIGDRIRIIDKDVPIDAVILDIQAFYTHIRTVDNEMVVIPNNLFLQKIVALK